jgi:hypothetical protein
VNSLVAAKSGASEKTPAGFEDKLIWLCKFGQPRVSNTGNGWYASIEMHVSAQGAKFEIRSEFGCATPSVAADMLIQRMLEALARLSA